jgi:hypothetical protein
VQKFTWSRFGGYEVSSKGDSRFSAFKATLADGRSIEQHYQCDVKGYDIGGTNWRLGKGNPPLRSVNLLEEYVGLWRNWAMENMYLMRILYKSASSSYILSDRFATTEVNQANALSTILNELCSKGN